MAYAWRAEISAITVLPKGGVPEDYAKAIPAYVTPQATALVWPAVAKDTGEGVRISNPLYRSNQRQLTTNSVVIGRQLKGT